MEPKFFKLPVCVGDVTLRVAKGHFATRNSHINYFIDVTAQKYSLKGCRAVARELANRLQNRFQVDSILCMDGTSAVGACLARKLTQQGGRSLSEGDNMYIVKGELDSKGNLIFRDNARFMLEGKNILLLLASVTTGGTVRKGIECVRYYQGIVAGIAAVYSQQKEIDGVPVVSLFDTNDLPGYASYLPEECPMCREKQELDAVVDKFGYSAL